MVSAFSLLCRDHCYRFNYISWYTCTLKQSHRWTLAAIKHKLGYPISCNSFAQPTNLLFTVTTRRLPTNDAGGKRYSIYGRHGWREYDSKLSHLMDCINFPSIHLSWSLNSLHATHPKISFHPSIYLEGSKLSHLMDCINFPSIHLSWIFNSLHATHLEISFHPSIYLEGSKCLVMWWIVLTSRLSIYVVTLLRWSRPNTHVSQSFAI
jgi:hypothetical protein